MSRDTDQLLAAYVDGVSELSTDERRRVEARLADDPALRDDAAATRELLGALRELPPRSDGPDWAALERSIHAAVGDAAPPRRFLRAPARRWIAWLVPAVTLATAAAIVIVVNAPSSNDATAPVQTVVAPTPRTDERAPSGEPVEHSASAVWLDGAPLELDDDALDALERISDRGEPELVDELELLPMAEDWIDGVAEDALDDVERALDESLLERKRS